MQEDEKRIAGFRLDSTGVLDCAGQMRALGYRVCAMEDKGRGAGARAELKDVTVAEVCDAIVAANAGYAWEQVGDLLNIYPTASILDERIGAVHAKGKSMWRILREDVGIEQVGLTIVSEMESEDPLLDVDLEPGDVRHALNGLVERLPKAFWQISGTAGAFFLMISD